MRMAALRNGSGASIATAALIVTMLWPLSAGAEGVSINAANREQLQEAQESYKAGVDALEAERYDEAKRRFQESYDVVASPNSRLMLARTLVKLGELPSAYRELEATLEQAKDLARGAQKYEKTVESAELELAELRKKLAFITVESATRVTVAGEEVPAARWNLEQPVEPGDVEVRIVHDDGRETEKTLKVEAGDSERLAADVPAPKRETAQQATPATAPASPAPTTGQLDRKFVGWTALGVGAVGFGMFGVFTYMNEASLGNVKASCNRGTCPETAVDDGKTKGMNMGLSFAGLGIGVLGAGVGAYLLLTGNEDQPEATATALSIGPSNVSLRGSF